MALRDKKEAKLFTAPSVTTQSGQRSSVQAGATLSYVKAYEEKEGKDAVVLGEVLVGSRFPVKPMLGGRVLGTDARAIDISYSIYLTRGEPVTRTVRGDPNRFSSPESTVPHQLSRGGTPLTKPPTPTKPGLIKRAPPHKELASRTALDLDLPPPPLCALNTVS